MIPLTDIGLALWLGILTSISPCPLATNIATVSYLSRQIDRQKLAVFLGLAYALGRTTTYVVLGFILVSSSHAVPAVSLFLQKHMSIILGPLLIIVGLCLLNVMKFGGVGSIIRDTTHKKLSGKGVIGAYALGVIFALSFCPVSAALFFGSTAALAVKHQSRLLIPGIYGMGSALPVVIFALLIVFSVHAVSRIFDKLTTVEKWARIVSGTIFIGTGIYYITTHMF